MLSFQGNIGYKCQENMKTYLENYDMDCKGELRADIQWSTELVKVRSFENQRTI